MNIILIIILIAIAFLIFLYILGSSAKSNQDKKIKEVYPNHPSSIDSKMFPVGSGVCHLSNTNRHIWKYSEDLSDSGPTNRTCIFCGEFEYRMISYDSGWISI